MLTSLDMHILEILCEDARVTPRELAVMTGTTEDQVQSAMEGLRRAGVLVGTQTLINWERTDREFVRAVIEVNVQPQREKGFDAIAQRIMQYSEAATRRELAQFVHSRLSVIEGVTGTATHFMLRTYKYGGTVFEAPQDDRRQAVMP